MNRLNKMKIWLKAKWTKLKAWVIALLVSLGLIVGVALADDVTLRWANATEWDDGTMIVAGDLAETVLDHQMFALGTDVSTEIRAYTELVRVPATVTSYVDANVANGIHCYVAYHIATNGQRSVYSDESCKTIDVRTPGNPTGLTSN